MFLRRSKYLISIIVLTGIFVISCENAYGKAFDGPDISAEDFIAEKDNEEIVILDVRTPAEYKQGHIENAILINIKAAGAYDKINQLDKNKTYYVYCRTGIRSGKAVNFMRNNGFDKSFNIIGGIISLQRKGIRLIK